MKLIETEMASLWTVAERGWLGERSGGFRQALRREAHLQRFAQGEYTHHIGDGPGGIYGVVEGSFGVYTQSEAAGVVLVHIFRPGAWFGQGPLTSGRPRYLAFRAMEPSRVASVALPAVERVIRDRPDAQREVLSLSEYNQVLMARALSEVLIRKADLRIASVLLRILENGAQEAEADRLWHGSVTQSELSEMANASRHTVNTVLKRFEAAGWITLGYGRIGLRDAAALRAFTLG
ncbi:Crp/Fnr family transcriptional regulator [Salipiger sp. P9]|uniref:Crp/Fnr family transcriptional regulator n=1 Tax=Salipiger pentaromativorans TaxID=2943193 RepID=UPI00215761D2|nr:Crp/Fnr family transcriptional regulator [Salipiger pentaromativorans]MCR8546415.1 Crp/Fnr family transcriptional regulator [Salipiger pentaromativorans]